MSEYMQWLAGTGSIDLLDVDDLGVRSEALKVGQNCGSQGGCQGRIFRKNGPHFLFLFF